MRNPGGYAVITSPEAGVANFDRRQRLEIGEGTTEIDSFTCFHCNSVVHVLTRQDPTTIGGLCKQCMKLICPKCTDEGSCVPFEKKLERWEARDRALRSYGF